MKDLITHLHTVLVKELITHLQTEWSVALEGELKGFLGIYFKRGSNGSWSYDCSAYIVKSANKFNQYTFFKDLTTPLLTKFSVKTTD